MTFRYVWRTLLCVGAFWLSITSSSVTGTSFAQRPADLGPTDSAEHLTHALLTLHGRYQQAHPAERVLLMSDLQTIAAKRQQLLAALIEDDPGEVLRVAIPAAVRTSLPPTVQAYVEEEVEGEGELEVLYEDYDTQSRLLYFLKTDSERFSLHFAASPPKQLLTGTQVRVSGVQINGVFALESEETSIETLALASSGASTATATTSVALPNTFGAQQTLVLLINFQDNPSDKPWTVEQARNVVFNEVSDFFWENSYGQTWLSGDVFGWYTISLNSTSCNTTWIAQQADAAAAASGVDLSVYSRFLYLFPRNSTCSWSGVGTVGGNPSRVWSNGKLELKVIGHELGHNFGLQHSHALECGLTTLGTNCQTYEYGDHLDIMGNYTAGHFNVFQKEQLGWLGYGVSPPITTVETNGTYSFEPYEVGGAGAKALKILKGIDPATGARSWYYLEYRQALGFDSFVAGNDNILNGVVVRLGTDSDRNSSFFLDMTPESTTSGYYDWEDPALESGMSYTDLDSDLTITTAWTDGGGATVHVDFGAQACVHANPALSFSPSQSQAVTPGTAVSYTVNVTNQDTSACGASQFNLQAIPPLGWTATLTSSLLSLQPGTSASTTLTVISPISIPDGFYGVAVTAGNSGEIKSVASGSAIYVVNGGNHAPVAVDDTAATTESTTVTIAVLANDSDPDGDSLQVVSLTQGSHGQVNLNSDGAVSYMPDPRFKGSDSFNYSITDGADTATATVTVLVEKAPSGGNGGSGGKGGGKPGGK